MILGLVLVARHTLDLTVPVRAVAKHFGNLLTLVALAKLGTHELGALGRHKLMIRQVGGTTHHSRTIGALQPPVFASQVRATNRVAGQIFQAALVVQIVLRVVPLFTLDAIIDLSTKGHPNHNGTRQTQLVFILHMQYTLLVTQPSLQLHTTPRPLPGAAPPAP